MWDSRSQSLHYIDNTGCKVHTYHPATGSSRTLEMPSVITTLVLRESGGAVVTLRSGIHFLDLETGELELIHPLSDPPPHVFNDGKVDSHGRFMIGASTPNSANPGPDGGLFRLDPDLSLHKLDEGVHYSNSPCWSPDGRTFYFSDSWIKTTYAYEYDPQSGAVANRRVFLDTSQLGGLPDGATVDEDGLFWVALYGAGRVVAVSPAGEVVRSIDLPAEHVSSVAFGGPDLDQLYVTTITHDFSGEGDGHHDDSDNAGSLFVIEGLGVRGRPEPFFAG